MTQGLSAERVEEIRNLKIRSIYDLDWKSLTREEQAVVHIFHSQKLADNIAVLSNTEIIDVVDLWASHNYPVEVHGREHGKHCGNTVVEVADAMKSYAHEYQGFFKAGIFQHATIMEHMKEGTPARVMALSRRFQLEDTEALREVYHIVQTNRQESFIFHMDLEQIYHAYKAGFNTVERLGWFSAAARSGRGIPHMVASLGLMEERGLIDVFTAIADDTFIFGDQLEGYKALSWTTGRQREAKSLVCGYMDAGPKFTGAKVEHLFRNGVAGTSALAAAGLGLTDEEAVSICAAFNEAGIDAGLAGGVGLEDLSTFAYFGLRDIDRMCKALQSGLTPKQAGHFKEHSWASPEEIVDWAGNNPDVKNLGALLMLDENSFEGLRTAAKMNIEESFLRSLRRDYSVRPTAHGVAVFDALRQCDELTHFAFGYQRDTQVKELTDKVGRVATIIGREPLATAKMLARRVNSDAGVEELGIAIMEAEDDALALAITMAEDRHEDGGSVNYKWFMKNLKLI